MSNSSYLTTKKHIKSYNIHELLCQINDRRFGGNFSISQANGFWDISYMDNWDNLEINPCSTRKLSFRDPNGIWMCYVGVVFRHELGKITDAILSSECLEETWKPNPKKYPTYVSWLNSSKTLIKDAAKRAELVAIELEYCPEEMRKY